MSSNNPGLKVGAPTVQPENTVPVEEQEDLNLPYTEHRTIIISLVHNYSNYRKANMKVLGQRKETIGSSISSCRTLASNKGEIEAYFPALIGLSPSNPEFITRVKSWLSNIQFVVNENDKPLDISFKYKTKADYLKFKKKEEAIDAAYAKVNRADTSAIKQAVKVRVEALNELEGQKYLVGSPINLEQYLIYRHCLLYSDVAKDIALINSDPRYRFYIKDEEKEREKKKKMIDEQMKAMRNFAELGANPSKYEAVYTMMIASKNENIAEALIKDSTEKTAMLIAFVNEHPDKFNKFFSDKNIVTKAFIEKLIVRGELVRAEFNQQISTADGTFIGSNMNEAVAFFSNPDNKELKDVFENKLKLL